MKINKKLKIKEKRNFILLPFCGQQGTVVVYVGILILVLIGFAALAVDIGHLYVARNELQNAADAGALAGARELYINNGTEVNLNANQIAYNTAIANNSQNLAVEVNWTAGTNTGDVQRGHWSFATRQFTHSDRQYPPDFNDLYSTADMDNVNTFSPPYVNAVRVVARRESTPVAMTFARIFGFPTYPANAEAIAYLGWAGSLLPGELKQPIAICRQAILNFGSDPPDYDCGVGRFINSGQNTGHQTGGWTNFSQDPPYGTGCDTASTPTVRPLVCGSGNPGPVSFNQGIGTTGGEIETAFDQLRSCWHAASYDNSVPPDNVLDAPVDGDGDGWPEHPWRLLLPVIDCPSNNTGTCATLAGAVVIDVIWMTRTDKNQFLEVPKKMYKSDGTLWQCNQNSYSPPLTNQECWYGRPDPNNPNGPPIFQGFADAFTLKDVLNNSSAIYEDKTIYFKPDCSPHEPSGTSEGSFSGVLAKIPKLVAPPRN